MSGQSVKLLFAQADKTVLTPVLDALREKGIKVSEGSPEGDEILLAALSENFYKDKTLTDALLAAVGKGGDKVLPLQLDKAAIPDDIKNAIYARNIISVGGRGADLVADRIIDALPAKKSRLPIAFIAGGAALLALAVFMIVRSMQGTPVQETAPAAEETQEEIAYPLPAGLTAEELARIKCVAVIGEHFNYYKTEEFNAFQRMGDAGEDIAYQLANESGEGDRRWYWNGDGSEVTMTPYDLRFLSMMPHLEEIHLVNVRVTDAPDLSGVTTMTKIYARDCDLGDLNWIAQSGIREAHLRCDADYSPLGNCQKLQVAQLELAPGRTADFSAFTPPDLLDFSLDAEGNGNAADLSGLAGCKRLKYVNLSGLAVTDLSFLQGKVGINRLHLNDLRQLGDISAVGSLTGLNTLQINNCPSIGDYSPVGACRSLQQLFLSADFDNRIQDASFVGNLNMLEDIVLSGVALPNLDFLTQISQGRTNLKSLELNGSAGDYSGLAAFGVINRLSLRPDNSADAGAIYAALTDSRISYLTLGNLDQVDISALPQPAQELTLDRCAITDLTSAPEEWAVPNLTLSNCQTLRSLEGLESPNGFGKKGGILKIYNCPRLTDFSAMEGMDLSSLEITGGYVLPEEGNFRTGAFLLDSVAGIENLDFLNEMDNSQPMSFKFVGIEGLENLKPLERFHGTFITVSPELEEQAKDLVQAGNFNEYHIEYPQGGWELDNSGLTLLSLDELETLPDALLRRVERFSLAGDVLFDPDENEGIWKNWEDGDRPELAVHNFDTGEERKVARGSGVVESMDYFEKLTGLHFLNLWDQPLESVDGIQNLRELHDLGLAFCDNLSDISPVFALQNLHSLWLNGPNIESIQGVQNLTQLCRLDISDTGVSDLSPLAEVDYSTAVRENGGFEFAVSGHHIEDFSPLSAVPAFSWLMMGNADPVRYVSVLEGKEIRSFQADSGFSRECTAEDVNALFAEFVRNHPELEELDIPWNDRLTDLTPLLELENLQKVRISANMEAARASLEGADYNFMLEIEGE